MAKKKLLAFILCIATIASLTVLFSLNSFAQAAKINAGPYNNSWEIKDNSTQLLVRVTNDAVTTMKTLWDNRNTYTYKITFTDSANVSKTVALVPSAAYDGGNATIGGWGILYFAPVIATGENQFIPVKDATYTVKMDVYNGTEPILYTDTFSTKCDLYVVPQNIPAEGVSGTYGNINWSIDKNGVCVISGTGNMKDYEASYRAFMMPWAPYKKSITKVIIGHGVTSVGHVAFSNCPNLSEVYIADTVTKLVNDCFGGGDVISKMYIPSSVTEICQGAVYTSTVSKVFYTGDAAAWTAITKGSYNTAFNSSTYTYGDFDLISWDIEGIYSVNVVTPGTIPDLTIPAGQIAFTEKEIVAAAGDTTYAVDFATVTGSYPETHDGWINVIKHTVDTTITDHNTIETSDGKPHTFINIDVNDNVVPCPILEIMNNQSEYEFVLFIDGTYYDVQPYDFLAWADNDCSLYFDMTDVFAPVNGEEYDIELIIVKDDNALWYTGYISKCGINPTITLTEPVTAQLSDTITWTLGTDNTLTISGTGIIPDYDDNTKQPWYTFNGTIRKVVVEEGITKIGKNAFSRIDLLEEIVVGEGVTTINGDALAYDELLTTVTLPASITTLQQGVVWGSSNIETVNYTGTEAQWTAFVAANVDSEAEGYNGPMYNDYLNVTPTYITDTFTVTWSVNGTTTTAEVEENAVPTYAGTPAKDGYTFAGWSDGTTTYTGALPAVTADVTYTAQFTKNVAKYTVTWSVNGTETTAELAENTVPEYTGTPAKDGYKFAGWSDGTTTYNGALPAVTADVTYTAQFTKDVPTPPTSDLTVYAAIIVVIALAGAALVIKKKRA